MANRWLLIFTILLMSALLCLVLYEEKIGTKTGDLPDKPEMDRRLVTEASFQPASAFIRVSCDATTFLQAFDP